MLSEGKKSRKGIGNVIIAKLNFGTSSNTATLLGIQIVKFHIEYVPRAYMSYYKV